MPRWCWFSCSEYPSWIMVRGISGQVWSAARGVEKTSSSLAIRSLSLSSINCARQHPVTAGKHPCGTGLGAAHAAREI